MFYEGETVLAEVSGLSLSLFLVLVFLWSIEVWEYSIGEVIASYNNNKSNLKISKIC